MYDCKTQDIALKYEVKEDRAVITLGKPMNVSGSSLHGFGKWCGRHLQVLAHLQGQKGM